METGTLLLQGGDGGSTSGDFNVADGAVLNFQSNFDLAAAADISGAGTVLFSGGAINVGGTYSVTGTSAFTGATVNFNSPIANLGVGPLNISGGAVYFNSNDVTVLELHLSGGILGGTVANVNSTGLLTWTSGTMSGSGVTNANGGALFGDAVNFGQLFLDERTLNLAAGQTATLQGPTYFYLSNGATLHNAGTFLAQNDYVIYHNGGAAGTFNNAGTFTRDTGSGAFTIAGNVIFHNTGIVNVETGTLLLQAAMAGAPVAISTLLTVQCRIFQSNFDLAAEQTSAVRARCFSRVARSTSEGLIRSLARALSQAPRST